MKKPCRKCAPKASPRPVFNFAKKTQNSHCTQEIILKIRYSERGLSKTLKKVKFFFFRTQSLLMDKFIKNKRGLELAASPCLGHETSSEKFLESLYII